MTLIRVGAYILAAASSALPVTIEAVAQLNGPIPLSSASSNDQRTFERDYVLLVTGGTGRGVLSFTGSRVSVGDSQPFETSATAALGLGVSGLFVTGSSGPAEQQCTPLGTCNVFFDFGVPQPLHVSGLASVAISCADGPSRYCSGVGDPGFARELRALVMFDETNLGPIFRFADGQPVAGAVATLAEIPEPASWALVLTGIAVYRSWRRRNFPVAVLGSSSRNSTTRGTL